MSYTRIYQWKNFDRGVYQTEQDELQSYPISEIEVPELFKKLVDFFRYNYDFITIPEEKYDLLESLLEHYGIRNELSFFLLFGCSLQYNYDVSVNLTEDRLLEDFDNQKKAFAELLDVLEKYLFSESLKDFHSISFKSITEDTISIKNKFVISDIYDAICDGFAINKENFVTRKEELLTKTNPYILKNLGEKVKLDYVHLLFEYLTTKLNEPSESDLLRFIGAFFHIFQVPTNKKAEEIELYDDIDLFLKSIYLTNLKHYISADRPPKIKH